MVVVIYVFCSCDHPATTRCIKCMDSSGDTAAVPATKPSAGTLSVTEFTCVCVSVMRSSALAHVYQVPEPCYMFVSVCLLDHVPVCRCGLCWCH